MTQFRWSQAIDQRRIHRIAADTPIYVISDIHLGDGNWGDIFLHKDRELLEFLDHVDEQGATLIVAGDAVDFSQAWFFTNVLRVHGKVLGRFSDLASAGRLFYVLGNHDHDLRFYTDVLRIPVVHGVQIGQSTLVLHGYEFDPVIGVDLDGTELRTRVHHLVERALKTWIRLPLEHFYTKSNRLSFWLFHKVSHLKRAWARHMDERFGGQRLRAAELELDYWLRCQIGDPAGLWRPIRDALETSPYQTLITGHSHLPGVVSLPNGRTYANSGSWTFGSSQYLLLQDGELTSKDWISGKEYGDRLYQPLLSDAYEGMTFDAWWDANYMGLLRYRAGEARRRATS